MTKENKAVKSTSEDGVLSESETESSEKKAEILAVEINDGCLNIKSTSINGKLFGSTDANFRLMMINAVISALPSKLREQPTALTNVLSLLNSINPQDELEGLLASQMTINQQLITHFLPRIVHPEQTAEGVHQGINRIHKLMSLFCKQVETLKKYRDGGTQTIQVQHVNVNEGGQALVGNVKVGGGCG